MIGLVKAKEKITLSGRRCHVSSIHKRALNGLGYLPQETSIFRDLSVEENIYSVLIARYQR